MALSIYSPLCQLTPSDNTPAVPVPPEPVESLGESGYSESGVFTFSLQELEWWYW